MVRNVKIAGVLFVVVALLVVAAFLYGRHSRGESPAPVFSPSQQISAQFSDTGLTMMIETDKMIYDYDDIIYVTARLINNTDKPVKVSLPNGTGYHQEIEVKFVCDAYQVSSLLDMDFYYYTLYSAMKPTNEPQVMVLEPGECYSQNMRFSTNRFLNPVHQYPVNLISGMPSGAYTGTFQVLVRTENQDDIPFSAQIGITVETRSN